MSDPFDKLDAAMKAATPEPDRLAKAKNLNLAMENFDLLQGSATPARPTAENRPMVGRLMAGVSSMIQSLSTRGGLVATTAIVAFGLIVISPQGRSLLTPPDVVLPSASTPKETRSRNDTDGQLSEADSETVLGENTAATQPVMEAPVVLQEMADAPANPAVTSAISQSLSKSGSNLVGGIAPMPARRLEYAIAPQQGNTEAFSNEAPNQLSVTTDDPVSTFSIDVDTASYGVVRSSLHNGMLPPANAVRVEEMVNYFPYNYATPDSEGAPFRPTVSVMQTPWNADTQLVHIALQGQMPAIDDRPPLNLVFLIDTSGSMQNADKLPLLKQSFRLMLGQLRPQDQVAIVTYAGSAGLVLEPTKADDRAAIIGALDQLEAGGSTAGQQGLKQAYSVAETMAQDGEVSRVVLATDGDFNVGLSDPEALKNFIADKRDSGTYLSVLGFGRGNLDDATMQALAQNGNGQAAYIDTLNEAQKVLVDQLSGALFPIANDVKIQVEFNPATIAEYRLIGYETRALKREDFNNDKVDAGEIGAGHAVTAIYEVTPTGSQAVLNNPLRYQTDAADKGTSSELGFLRLRYKQPGGTTSALIEMPIL
ncbi:MAG: VWA domain-containing protein, partial [Marinosulfonomonas sp.]|nr:VWA domain-containing protein [Marinosulfonomonas sp.]